MHVSSGEAENIVVSDVCKDGLKIYHFLNKFLQVIISIPFHLDIYGYAMFVASNLVTNK